MRGKRAKAIMAQARVAALDGSVVKSHEYKRLKKLHNNPHYAPVKVLYPTRPGKEIREKRIAEVKAKNKTA